MAVTPVIRTPSERMADSARNIDIVFRRMLATLKAFEEIAGSALPPEKATEFSARVKVIDEEVV